MEKFAAFEEIRNATLDQIPASKFIAALNSQGMTLIPKDKRREYWNEPERVPDKIDMETMFERLRNRKKWFELEKFPGFERHADPIDLVSNPELVNQLADAVAQRLQRR